MHRHCTTRWAVTVALLLSSAGCTPEAHQYIRFPRFFDPGPAGLQRLEAIRHDPYPLPDVAPEIEGARPREYQQPVPEVDRTFMEWHRRAALQRPFPIVPPPPPPVVTAPYPPPLPPPPAAPFPVQPRPPF